LIKLTTIFPEMDMNNIIVNLKIQNRSPEEIEKIKIMLSLMNINYPINVEDHFEINESRYIIPKDKYFPVHLPDSRYIKYSKLDPMFSRELVNGEYKDIYINPYRDKLIKTVNGEPKSIILRSPKNKIIIVEDDFKTSYYNYSLGKSRVILAQRLKGMMFASNPEFKEKRTSDIKIEINGTIILIIMNGKLNLKIIMKKEV
jgi:hypothetical protein